MDVLRITDRRDGGGHRVTVSWRQDGRVPNEVELDVPAMPVDPDSDRVRWYLEDYAEYPADPGPEVARLAEADLSRLGEDLFRRVFGAGGAGLWALARTAPGALRIEVDADPADQPGLPWELLRDVQTSAPVAVTAQEFVRTHHRATFGGALPADRVGRDGLRVLLVISRPGGADDVAFRSVASRLVRAGAEELPGLELDVLRPPTFARLAAVLRGAAQAGSPYDVVHFDGHGTYLDATRLGDEDDDRAGDGDANGSGSNNGDDKGLPVPSLTYGVSTVAPARAGKHGYLLFEDPNAATNQQLVDGPTLAALLVETRVPVVVLNACRSAYGEPATTESAPESATPSATGAATGAATEAEAQDVHARIRAYGSLAAEIADAGVPGVVAMRYNVYVVTAAQFVADLYTELLAGRTLGQAASAARKALFAQPTRQIGPEPVALQDWVVPTVYEAVPLRLAPDRATAPKLTIDLTDRAARPGADGPGAPDGLPRPPDAGFHGRDEALLALDRAFDKHRLVLLHALAGAGKSTTAAEFARWYRATGGLGRAADGGGNGGPAGVVMWTSFEHHTPLDRVLDTFGVEFAAALEGIGVQWAAITDPQQRRSVAMQVLAQVPVLWVWDNVEPVAGFPTGTPSNWSDEEQADLKDFLQELKQSTQARVLLTSRRSEESWLGALPIRVALAAMPMRERLALAHALAPQLGRDLDWRPLLRFTGGNPLTITVAVRQAVRDHVTDTSGIEQFTARLEAGLAGLEDDQDAKQGRTRSLAASLDYGFSQAFTEDERAALAVLHLFRDTVDIDALALIGDPETAGQDAVPALTRLFAEHHALNDNGGVDVVVARTAMSGLLDRAAEVGLLTALGRGYYGIHPALPWYFTGLFSRHHGPAASPPATAAERAYTGAYAQLGRLYHGLVEQGRATQTLPVLRAEEGNLRHALRLAHAHRQSRHKLGCLQALQQLYQLTGRSAIWLALLDQVVPEYVDTETDQPLPGQEDVYSIITGYRVHAARNRRDWPEATRLQHARTAWNRGRARPYLNIPRDELTDDQRHLILTLAISEQDLGRILAEQGDADCLAHLQAHHDLNARVADTPAQAHAATNLGTAHLSVPHLRALPRSLDTAEHWYQRSLDLRDPADRIGRALTLSNLGNVALERFDDARAADGTDPQTLLDHLTTALRYHQEALDLLPDDHHEFRGAVHNQLGLLYRRAGMTSEALRHCQQSIRHKEARGDIYGAGQTRFNIALLLAGDERVRDALLYANASHANFTAVGPGAHEDAESARHLIEQLTQELDG